MTPQSKGGEAADTGSGNLLTRREALARFGMLGLGLASAGAGLSSCSSGDDRSPDPSSPTDPGPGSDPANVLLIIADDMRYDHLQFMPKVQRLIGDEGRMFTEARCNVPLCQPSRVGLLTGQMSKHNNELGLGYAGTQLEDHDNSLGKWMNDAEYRCGLFGKYVNFTDGHGGINAPAGYHTWREFMDETSADEFKVHLNTGTITISGQYTTDYFAAEATRFLLENRDPLLCIVTPTQPHAPFLPRADLKDKWLDFEWPIVDEEDVSDKPRWIRALPPLDESDRATIRANAIGALQELSAVDDMVEKILTGMDPGVLNNTVVIFTSDNGVHHGEHRRRGAATKSGPYEVGLHVPLLVRGPGFAPGPAITVPTLAFQDIAATILDLGHATAGLPHQAGTSLVELCENPNTHRERILLHEIGRGFESQTGDGITTGPDSSLGFRKLFRYPSVRTTAEGPFTYEAYDLNTDPDELSNWADDPARRTDLDALEAQLDALLES